ncbi:hypothetical protein ACEWY4_010799 [Coilia grayii]|uniref:Ig-like domain-containing protein n=1 Tax=Coilia grayii TaxID=363190 RepID=A0ABD1K303_9TELE
MESIWNWKELISTRLDDVLFDCGCDIRWLQLWQQRGEAGLQSQQLFCTWDTTPIPLQAMNITHCDLPEVSVTHSNLTVTEGDKVIIFCNGTGMPVPEVDWKVKDLISINQHQSFLINGTNVHAIKLTLVNISREDNNFMLNCVAENTVGMTNASVQLTVHFPPSIIKLDEPERRHHTCIEFTVRGYPHPTLRWYKDGRELAETPFVHTEMDIYKDYLEGCLTFRDPTQHNNGNYTLEASNFLGVASKTVHGHFLDPPYEEYEDYGTPTPTITVTHRPEEDTFGVSIAVGLAGFACLLLVIMFVLINKYGRRSKFGMKVPLASPQSFPCPSATPGFYPVLTLSPSSPGFYPVLSLSLNPPGVSPILTLSLSPPGVSPILTLSLSPPGVSPILTLSLSPPGVSPILTLSLSPPGVSPILTLSPSPPSISPILTLSLSHLWLLPSPHLVPQFPWRLPSPFLVPPLPLASTQSSPCPPVPLASTQSSPCPPAPLASPQSLPCPSATPGFYPVLTLSPSSPGFYPVLTLSLSPPGVSPILTLSLSPPGVSPILTLSLSPPGVFPILTLSLSPPVVSPILTLSLSHLWLLPTQGQLAHTSEAKHIIHERLAADPWGLGLGLGLQSRKDSTAPGASPA